jgi:hypothetical protein
MGQFYTVQELSANQSKTPEGYLLCESVPIARTGEQLYACTEVPIDPTPTGVIRVMREPDQVFRPETLSSFEGKPVTLTHPDDKVDPASWREVAVGTATNVRRGAGIEDDYVFADLLITDAEAIAAIEAAKSKGAPMQVSCGYDAEYEQLEPGVGRQFNIVGNHVALVERGRAGSRCAIKDEEIIMSKPTPKAPASTWWDRASAAFMKRDAKALRTAMKDADGPGDEEDEDDDKATKDDVAEVKKTCDALQKTVDGLPAVIAKAVKDAMEEEKKPPTEDEVALAAQEAEKLDGGEVMTGDSLVALMSRVEILTPGAAVPTGDAVKTKGLAGRIMRGALVKATADAKTGPVIAPIVAGVDFKTLTVDALRPLFNAAVEVARIANNTSGRHDAPRTTKDFGRTVTPAEINAQNAKFYGKA